MWKTRSVWPAAAPLALVGAVLLGGCAAPDMGGPQSGNVAADPTSVADAQQPTTLADMQDATILDVDRYRPQLLLPACGPRQLPLKQADPQMASALEEAKAYSDTQGGLGLIVMRDGEIIHESYADGVGQETQTTSASMAKSVLALMFGIAFDKGMFASVDEPLGEHLVEWSDDPRGAITLREALQMRSGLAPSDFRKVLLAPNVSSAALETPLAGEPGATFSYNNAVSQILSLALDRRVRQFGYKGYTDFLERELWCPLGNGAATLWIDQSGNMRGYAGIHASLRDWARIGELIRNKGKLDGSQIVSEKWIGAMSTPSPANPQYGFQVWLGADWTKQRRYSAENPITIPHSEPFEARDIVYFDGFGGQRVYVVPSKNLTIARVGNVSLEYDDSVIPNTLVRASD